MQSSRPKLIYFSGSGARIASHLGAAYALEEAGVVAEEYGGISGGAIVATFAGLGKVREVADKVLGIQSGDIFEPDIFREDGSIHFSKALWGLILNKGEGLCRLKIEKLLNPLLQGEQKAGKVWALVYNNERREVVKVEIVGDCGIWPLSAFMLQQQASFPILNPPELFGDAGLTLHYPERFHEADESDLYFSVVAKEEAPKRNIWGQLMGIFYRLAEANKSRVGAGTYITLPTLNGHTEYNPDKMRQSFDAAYAFTKEKLCQA
jgi:hypothetical protein